MTMLVTETWWEDIFSGALAIGLNEQKIRQLEDESFLYFNEPQTDQQNNSFTPSTNGARL